MATMTKPTAADLHAVLASIDLDTVPVMSTERHIPRKEQAALARRLFRQLGVRGISVTAPNYSMAHSVDVRLPGRTDYTVRRADGSIDYPTDPAAAANRAAEDKVCRILAKAFPAHTDRSDYASDYYDYCWSVDTH